ncbi:hypothetical protein T484DRAFT_1757631 [Baffinella frigidus]|nr:hypothetical protein T484DRAFT_1757631 [Cryptophyta sp. CCMP2293]
MGSLPLGGGSQGEKGPLERHPPGRRGAILQVPLEEPSTAATSREVVLSVTGDSKARSKAGMQGAAIKAALLRKRTLKHVEITTHHDHVDKDEFINRISAVPLILQSSSLPPSLSLILLRSILPTLFQQLAPSSSSTTSSSGCRKKGVGLSISLRSGGTQRPLEHSITPLPARFRWIQQGSNAVLSGGVARQKRAG